MKPCRFCAALRASCSSTTSFSKFYVHAKYTASDASKDDKSKTFVEVKYGNAGGRMGLAADRSVGNMMEQAIPFLVSLWLHALVVGAPSAAQTGWLWIASRAIYPLVFQMGLPYLFLSTIPGYLCILYMLSGVAARVL